MVLHRIGFAYIFGSVLNSRTSPATAIAPLLLAFLFLFSSCTKEKMVSPCQGDAAEATTKGLSVPNDGVVGDPSNGNTRGGEDPSTGEDGISDDGDDISDTERKKR